MKDLIDNSKSITESKCSRENILKLISQLEKIDLKYSYSKIKSLSRSDYSSLQEMISCYNHMDNLCRSDSISLNNPSNFSGGSSIKDSILSWKSKLSMNRKIRLEAMQLDYHIYLKFHQSIFVTRCQMINIECLKIQKDN